MSEQNLNDMPPWEALQILKGRSKTKLDDMLIDRAQQGLTARVDRLAEIEGELIAFTGGDAKDGKEALERIRQKLTFAPVQRECRNCEAYLPYGDAVGGINGQCRASSPQFHPDFQFGLFPRVAVSDWCLQFRAKPEAAKV